MRRRLALDQPKPGRRTTDAQQLPFSLPLLAAPPSAYGIFVGFLKALNKMATRDSSTSVHPKVQAIRMEQAARGEFLARTNRDADLFQAGAPAECLALIGGRDAATKEGAAAVALWLVGLAVREGYGPALCALYGAAVRAPVGHQYPYIFRTRAALALARQIVHLAASNKADPADTTAAPPALPPGAVGAGVWLASAIEGAALSRAVATLWQARDGTETTDPAPADVDSVAAVLETLKTEAEAETDQHLT